MISDLTLRWIVTALFSVTIATYSYALVAQRLRPTNTVNHLLHVAMSVAMILMAWRAGIDFPTFGPIAFFVLAGVWFIYLAGRAARDGMINYYYAAAMAAMAWMYAVMNGSLLGQMRYSAGHAPPASMAMDSPGTDMSVSGMDTSAHQMSSTVTGPAWVTTVNWIVTMGFAVVTLYWACRYFAERRMNTKPWAARPASFEPITQAFTAAGTALMFGSLL